MAGIGAILATLFLSASPPAQGQVAQCLQSVPKLSPFQDGWLQRSVDELKAKHPALTFQREEPCGHAKATVNALARTLRRNYLKSITGYELVKLVSGDYYFTVERFRLRGPKDLDLLKKALKSCHLCKLEIEENTCLDHFFSADSAVFMISSAAGCKDNAEKFRLIQQSFLSSEGASAGK